MAQMSAWQVVLGLGVLVVLVSALADRLLVGMGAGQAQVRVVVEIQGPDGQVLVRSESHGFYLGGLGMGAAGLVDIDDLVKRFAETVADTTVKWSRGRWMIQ